MSQQQQQSESTNGQYTNMPRYPSPTAKYEDVAQSSDLFWEKLKAFHKSLGKKFKVPVVGGKALDLHQLFAEVTSRGGLEKVIKDRRWKEVIVVFRFPTTITSASFVLRKYYLSLLYHFEQVYYFRKQVSSVSTPGTASGSLVNASANTKGGASANQLAAQGTPELQIGSSVTGTIDGKFDNGYLVTVRLGSDQFKGVLYHIPQMLQLSQSSNTSDVPPHRSRKRSRLALRDPSKPKSNRSGYNFFFAEHYTQLKPMYYGQEKAISKRIGHLWSNLTEAEKQVYQEKGMKDKERYRTEMLEYKSSYDSTPQ
ncbi:PREDICTED: high mobility group B protein 10 isoform X1 [Theobroma cacao]|uniref:High mobility group B protein 10 isoform X1 n=1 Tax=Theobroma cacao TaxID=3641 RepID=A0AB32UWA8_THECC|nr:PREDICTED: high mobility group B protein 10 isoform X1 [Theobroma cacao]